MNMTVEQWARLFLALGQVPCVDVAMNCDRREAAVLCELALKGLDWQQRGFLHYGTGDKIDALDLAARLGIDPATGQPKARPSDEAARFEACADRLDRFLDELAHAGE